MINWFKIFFKNSKSQKNINSSFIVPDKIEDVVLDKKNIIQDKLSYFNDVEKFLIEEQKFKIFNDNLVREDIIFLRSDQCIKIKRGNLSIVTPEITDIDKLQNYLRKYSK